LVEDKLPKFLSFNNYWEHQTNDPIETSGGKKIINCLSMDYSTYFNENINFVIIENGLDFTLSIGHEKRHIYRHPDLPRESFNRIHGTFYEHSEILHRFPFLFRTILKFFKSHSSLFAPLLILFSVFTSLFPMIMTIIILELWLGLVIEYIIHKMPYGGTIKVFKKNKT